MSGPARGFRFAPVPDIVYINEHEARALGYTREELCAMSFSDIVPNLTPEWWAAHRKKLAATSQCLGAVWCA